MRCPQSVFVRRDIAKSHVRTALVVFEPPCFNETLRLGHATTSRNGGQGHFEIEEETRRFPVGVKSCSGPPTRTPDDEIPSATVNKPIDFARWPI